MVYVVIPIHSGSVRFPMKFMVDICGRPMVEWVYCSAVSGVADVVRVAVDGSGVLCGVLEASHIPYIVTGEHGNGLSRVYEACLGLGVLDDDIVIDLQGDEPCLEGRHINRLIHSVVDAPGVVSTLCRELRDGEMGDGNVVKVGIDGEFSRGALPGAMAHIGAYGMYFRVLRDYVGTPASEVEVAESLEQLRFFDAGYGFNAVVVDHPYRGVDVPGDELMAGACLCG